MRHLGSALLLALTACATMAGAPVQERPEWYETVSRLGLPECADMPATYTLLPLETWRRRGYLSAWGGFTTDDNEVYARSDGYLGVYPPSWILRHEFTHVLLRCAGVPEAVHRAHEGSEWDGLRAGDPVAG